MYLPSPIPQNTQSSAIHFCNRCLEGKDNRQKRDNDNPHSSNNHTNL
jgi:hypothetical protein